MERKEEVSLKVERVRSLMDSMDLKGVVLKKQANYSWLTAGGKNMVRISSDTGNSTLLITRDDKYCVANRIEAERNMDEEGLSELGFTLVDFPWEEGDELEEMGKIVPLEQVGSDVRLDDALFVGGEIEKLRYSLTQPEIERYQWMGEKASQAVESLLKEVEPGDTEAEIAGRLAERLWQHRIDQVGFLVAADDRIYNYRHPIPTEKEVENYLQLGVMARKWGLITTVTRFLHFGDLSEELKSQYEDNVFIECSMIADTRPGKITREIYQKAKSLYSELGYENEWKLHHQGGAMGYGVRDYICDSESTEKVHENQAFCWNPSISGTKSEDGFIAQNEGFTFITKPMEFPTITVEAEGIEFERPAILER